MQFLAAAVFCLRACDPKTQSSVWRTAESWGSAIFDWGPMGGAASCSDGFWAVAESDASESLAILDRGIPTVC